MTHDELRAWAMAHDTIAMAARRIANRGHGYAVSIEPWDDEDMFTVVFRDLVDQDTETYFMGYDEIVEVMP